jgi:hypothetical protein
MVNTSNVEFADDDATFWPALPCRLCRAEDVPFCLDCDGDNVGACGEHIGVLLRQLVVDRQREVLVLRNCALPPLTTW